MVVSNPFVLSLVDKYSIQLDSSNLILTNFVKELTPFLWLHKLHGISDSLQVISCYEDTIVQGRRGCSIYYPDCQLILIFTGLFYQFFKASPTHLEDIRWDFISTLLHEAAHQVVDATHGITESNHGESWKHCYELLLTGK